MGLKLFERAVRNEQDMDKLFGAPTAKTLRNIGWIRNGSAPHLRCQPILFIRGQTVRTLVAFRDQLHSFLPHHEILKTFNFLFEWNTSHLYAPRRYQLPTHHA